MLSVAAHTVPILHALEVNHGFFAVNLMNVGHPFIDTTCWRA